MALERGSDFDAWFRELFPRAVGAAQRLLGSWAASEDVTAEAFARALERWRHVRDLDHRDAWLMRVVTNLAIDDLRRKPLPADGHDVASDESDAVGERLALGAALARLSKRQREAIVLRYVGQLSVARGGGRPPSVARHGEDPICGGGSPRCEPTPIWWTRR